MNKILEPLTKSHGFHIFQSTESSCGITTPQTFASGSPACYYMTITPQERIIIDDYGLNFGYFSDSLPSSDNAEKTMVRLVKETTEKVQIRRHRLICETTIQGLEMAIGEYINVLGRLTSYQPKTVEHQFIDEATASIYLFLINQHGDIVTKKPKVKGLSGCKHSFAFQAGNVFIDYVRPTSGNTGSLLRKIIDTQNQNDNARFQVILDDNNQEVFKREGKIISTFANITPLSRINVQSTLQ